MPAVEEDDLVQGPIYIGDTRPPMVPFLGIPFSAAVPLLFVATETQMLFGGLTGVAYALAITAPIALPLRWWCSYDWYAVENVILWMRTSGPAMDGRRWGGASLSHFPLRTTEIRGV
jgi:type IV secretion system protein VirB3